MIFLQPIDGLNFPLMVGGTLQDLPLPTALKTTTNE